MEELFADLNAVSAIIAADKVRNSEEEFMATIEKVFKGRAWENDLEGLDDFVFWIVQTLKRNNFEEEKIREILDGIRRGDKGMVKYGIDYIIEKREAKTLIEAAMRLIRKGKSLQEAADLLDLSNEQVNQLKEVTTLHATV